MKQWFTAVIFDWRNLREKDFLLAYFIIGYPCFMKWSSKYQEITILYLLDLGSDSSITCDKNSVFLYCG